MSDVSNLQRSGYQRFMKHHAALPAAARQRRGEIARLRAQVQETAVALGKARTENERLREELRIWREHAQKCEASMNAAWAKFDGLNSLEDDRG